MFGFENKWKCRSYCFSYLLDNKNLVFLDINQKLNYAKFIKGNTTWHGWPANGKRNSRDIPSYEILKEWVKKKVTSRSKTAKLRRRQQCSI